MHRQVTHSAPRRAAVVVALLGCLAVGVSAATSAPEAAARKVRLTLNGSGLGTWTIGGANENGQEAMRYSWRGTFTFTIPAKVLANPARAKFKVAARGTLRASWTGVLAGTVLDGFAEGPYRCEYKGANVPAPVGATLSNGKVRGRLLLTLKARTGSFFPARSNGSTINCISPYGQTAPPHFDPSWLFRDTVNDRGRLTRDTAFIGFSSKVLPRRTVKTSFPLEVGARDSNYTGNTRWRNRGVVTIKAR